MTHSLSSQSYGKCGVRLTRVSRDGVEHSLVELTADICLEGDFDAAYTDADNRLVIPTDTMKNTVYALAKKRGVANIESFGRILADHFIDRFDHVRRATVHLSEQPWQRITIDGVASPHAFTGCSTERFHSTVTNDGQSVETKSGLTGLVVLKTTNTGFSGFLRDEYTTLPDVDDRIFATAISADWKYRVNDADWTQCRDVIRQALLQVFATHKSLSVQQTLLIMGSAAIDGCDAISEISLSMPNQHRLLVDLEPFGLENGNEVFVPTDEPFGLINGTVQRSTDE